METEFRYSPKVTLRQGDKVRISGGPYYKTSSGNKYKMGVKGVHTFSHVDEQGHVWVRNETGMLVLVYMGEEKLSQTTGTHMRPHKLTKVRKNK